MPVERNDFTTPPPERQIYIKDHVERGVRLIIEQRFDSHAIIQCHGFADPSLRGCALTLDDATVLRDALNVYIGDRS